ncbi:hypothetical protein SRABI80_03338 [Peribacillus frigoritolerans]|uniref:hypothetical protein n=1 Tax=Peribacillus frigoritolerans TaxID=450367 RepID=UPI001D246DA9|nr:hypothetical protein [Peribacillus frigoritolerans]CAH0265887.1 hypothetical protein SRABI80_03338 [Peribacillus frigoritolerans]
MSFGVSVESYSHLKVPIHGGFNWSPAISQAILVAGIGGTVILPKGDIYISYPISLLSNMQLIGQGRDVTLIKPIFTSGNVIESKSSIKYKTISRDFTVKPDNYQYQLIGVNFKYWQYGTVERVDVFNCGVSYDFDGTIGCYYNKACQIRSVSCAYGIRIKRDDNVNGRANANTIDDAVIISPIIGVLQESGNTNLINNIRIESIPGAAPNPTVDPSGVTVLPSDRWVLKISKGTGCRFSQFRAEFNGNLVDLTNTYGNFLTDFYCNYNGVKDSFITLQETPTSVWQTNNLKDVELGYSLPVLTHEYYSRNSRLGQKIQLPPQISMTPRDSAGAPSKGEKGLIRMDSNAKIWVATAIDSFEKVAYETTASSSTNGPLRFHKNSINLEDVVISPESSQTVSIFMTGLQNSDSIIISTTMALPNGFIVYPARVDETTGYARVSVYNRTAGNLTLPGGTWTFTYVRA